MPLVKVNDLLKHATENKYGVAAFNVMNFETIKAAAAAAEREKVPVIIQFYPGFDKYCPLSFISHMAKSIAEKSAVPIAVHLDHSNKYEIAVAGIRDGFPSIMVDGSSLPFAENVSLTKDVIRVARIFGVDVEAELGHVGVGSIKDDYTDSDRFTNVAQAVEFVKETGCDSLAVAVGNAHGFYASEPNLDFDRIRELRSKLDIPLVLHGCSGIPLEQMKEAVNLGMSKFNIATEFFASMFDALSQGIAQENNSRNGVRLMMGIQEPMIEFAVDKIRMLNPNQFSIRI